MMDMVLWEEEEIGGKHCRFYKRGQNGPVILWGMFPHREDEAEHTLNRILETCGDREFVLAAYQVRDWNGELSPWEAPAVWGDVPFAGKGFETLSWLEKELVPVVREKYGDRHLITMGYSLAGLFSLWCLYESELFSGCICSSGSLWFPGWEEYVSGHRIRRAETVVYLSLGGKEEKTGNPVMARIGDRTREQERLLLEEERVRNTVLVWNPGGHFADPGKRLASGAAWILKNERNEEQ